MKERQTDDKLHGLLVIDKPLDWTSMDVIRKVRYAAGRGMGRSRHKVGHAGTLDPLATGVLVVCVGHATRLFEKLMGQVKVYDTSIDLSAFTASDDSEMPLEVVQVQRPPTLDEIDAALAKQTGLIEQVPPNFSAVWVDGARAYKAARRGEPIELKPRTVRVDAIERLGYDWPRLDLRITCGRGTYIRSIARDLGGLLGTGGFVTSLRRLSVGAYTLDQAYPVEKLEQGLHQHDLLPMPEL